VSTILTPGLMADIAAPLPTKRDFTLLDAAQTPEPANDRWMAGADIGGYPPGPAYTHDPCSTGTFRQKAAAGAFATQMAGAFTVYLPTGCTAATVGPDPDWFRDRLRLVFPVYESAAVERVLADGDGLVLGKYLADADMEVLGSGAVSPIEGLALLEKELGPIGNGIIHVPRMTATYWALEGLIEPARAQMRTKLGTTVAIGDGYNDVQPDGEAAPGANEEWAFVSGPIQITRSETFVLPDRYEEAFDRAQNDVEFIAERHYLIAWIGRQDGTDENNVQAGVLIDRTA
jgi:hypothetical protein